MEEWFGDIWDFPFDAGVWGTTGQYIGTIVTGGSFLLAANVYRKSRQDKRIEQASKVIFTWAMTLDAETDYVSRIKGSVYNHSDALIIDTAVIVYFQDAVVKKGSKRIDRFTNPIIGLIYHHYVQGDEFMHSVVMPDEPAAFEIQMPQHYKVKAEDLKVVLHFTDANSVTWNRLRYSIPTEHKYFGKWHDRTVAAIRWSRRTKARALKPFKKSK